MGLTNAFLKFCGLSTSLFEGKTILSLGNPSLNSYKYLRDNINPKLLAHLHKSHPFSQSRLLFCEAYRAKSFLVLDLSPSEMPDYVCDLNQPISPSHGVPQVDIVLDLGTAEHIFDNSIFLENIYRQLNVNGYYIFNLPANNFLEHGFRQYSPTFFYDLVRANKESLDIDLLCMHNINGLCIDVLNAYTPSGGRKIKALPYSSFAPNIILYGYSTLFSLLNRTAAPVYLLGIIRKNSTAREHLNLAAPQDFYSSSPNQSAKTITAKQRNYIVSYAVRALRKLFVIMPLPTSIKILILLGVNKASSL